MEAHLMGKDAPNDILTVAEAAKLLKVNPDTLRLLIQSGAIEAGDARRPGSTRPSYRIHRQALVDFVKKRPGEPPKPAKRKRRRRKMNDVIQFYK